MAMTTDDDGDGDVDDGRTVKGHTTTTGALRNKAIAVRAQHTMMLVMLMIMTQGPPPCADHDGDDDDDGEDEYDP